MNAIELCIRELRDAKKAAQLANASFEMPAVYVQLQYKQLDGTVVPNAVPCRADDYIKERIKLHHNSWIVGPIERAICLLEAQVELAKILERLDKALDPYVLTRIAELMKAGRANEDYAGRSG